MRRFLLPTSQNNYTPYLLHRSALVVYVLVIFLFNVIVGQLGLSTVQAAVDAGTLYSLHNSNRSANGLGALTVNNQLVTSATNKAQAMLASDCWDHYCPPGTSPWSFILNAGYEYIYAGENLGEGFSNSTTLMNAWMNSPTHRANVLSGNFTEIGIGFAYGSYQGNPNNTIVVVHFGSKQKVTAPAPTAVPATQVTTKTVTPTSKPAPTSVPTLKPTAIPGTNITDPQNGAILNTNAPEIKGTKPDVSVLDIFINDVNVGRVDTGGENFSFRPSALEDGAKTLKAVAYINDKQVNESTLINFTVDTVAPEIDQQKMEISYIEDETEERIKFKIFSAEDTVKVSTNVTNDLFIKNEDGTWEIQIFKELLEGDVVLGITAEDSAGNQTILEMPSSEILGQFEHNAFLSQDYDGNDIRTVVSGSLLGSISAGGIQAQVNFAFIIILFALFMFDFYVIHKSGLTGVKRSKSHLHLSAMIILILVAFMGGFGGSII
jgi:hypothetical protein